jgi:signal peptidase
MSVMLVIFVAMTVLRFTGGELLVVRTGSMEPEMSPGDLLISREVDPRTVRRGDVITFRVPSEDNTLVTHRVTSVQDDGNTFTTKGDANETADPFTTKAEDVLGTKWFVLPGIGRAVVFLASPIGTALLLGIPAAIYIGQSLADRRRSTAARAAVHSATENPADTPAGPSADPGPGTAAEGPAPAPTTADADEGLVVLPSDARSSAPPAELLPWPELGHATPTPLALPASALPAEVAERLGTSWVLVTPLQMSMAGLAAGAGESTASSGSPTPAAPPPASAPLLQPLPEVVHVPAANPF